MVSLAALRHIIGYYPATPTSTKILRPPLCCSPYEDEDGTDNNNTNNNNNTVAHHPPFAVSATTPRVRFLVEQICGYEVEGVDLVGLPYNALCRHEVVSWARRLSAGEDADDDDTASTPEVLALLRRDSALVSVVHDLYDPAVFIYTRWLVCTHVRMLVEMAWWLRRPLSPSYATEEVAKGFPICALHLSLRHLYTAVPFAELGIASLVRSVHVEGRQTDLSTLSQCTNLRNLDMSNCESGVQSFMEDLVAHTPDLASVQLASSATTDISWVRPLTQLLRVSFVTATLLEDTSPLSACRALRSVDLSFCDGPPSMRFVNDLPHLAVLNLQETPQQIAEDLTGCLKEMTALRVLNAKDCAWVAQVTGEGWWRTLRHLSVVLASGAPLDNWLPHLTDVAVLNVSYCAELADTTELARLTHLRVLTLTGCTNVETIEPVLLSCPALESLDVANCTSLTSLFQSDPAEHGRFSSRLREVHARRSGLEDLSHVDALLHLTTLDITGCEYVEDLSMLARLPHLERVWAAQTSVSDVEWAVTCPKLRELIWDEE